MTHFKGKQFKQDIIMVAVGYDSVAKFEKEVKFRKNQQITKSIKIDLTVF